MSRPMRSETEVAPEDQEETKGVLLGFVFERARGDDSLSYSETQIIIAAETNSHLRTTSGAFILGKRLAELGHKFETEVGFAFGRARGDNTLSSSQMQIISVPEGNSHLRTTSGALLGKRLAELAKINIGRIAALLAYCYHLIKTYIRSKIDVSELVTFLGLVTVWLVKFLFKANFYEWLRQQGGWGQLILSPLSAWLNSVGKHAFLVIGVASLLVWGYAVFRK